MGRRFLTGLSPHTITPCGWRDDAARGNSPMSGSSQARSMSAPPSTNPELRVNGSTLHQPKPISARENSQLVGMLKKNKNGVDDLATAAALSILERSTETAELGKEDTLINSADDDAPVRSSTPRPCDFSIRQPASFRQNFPAERRRPQRMLEPPRYLGLNQGLFFVSTARKRLVLHSPINNATSPPPPPRHDTPYPHFIESRESPSPHRLSIASQHLEALELDGEDRSFCPDSGPHTLDASAQRWELDREDSSFCPDPGPGSLDASAQRWEPNTEELDPDQSLESVGNVQDVQEVRESTPRPSGFSIRRPRGPSDLRRIARAERRVLKRRRNRRLIGRSIPTSATRSRSRSLSPRRQSAYEMSFPDGEDDSYCPSPSPSPSSGSIDWGPWASFHPLRDEPNYGFTDSEMEIMRLTANPISPGRITPNFARASSPLDITTTQIDDLDEDSFPNPTPASPLVSRSPSTIPTLSVPISRFPNPHPPQPQPFAPTLTSSSTWMFAEDGSSNRMTEEVNERWTEQRSDDQAISPTSLPADGEDAETEALAPEPEARGHKHHQLSLLRHNKGVSLRRES